jgi:hypothetical protein
VFVCSRSVTKNTCGLVRFPPSCSPALVADA